MMVRSSSQILLFLLWFLCGADFGLNLSRSNSQIRCHNKDREILLQFKKSVIDPSSLLSSWSNEEDCCKWIGIQCNNKTDRVSKLNLRFDFTFQNDHSKQLTGEINLGVLQLGFLNFLDLSGNNFTTILYLSNMPQHHNANISTLFYLDLSGNYYLKIDNFRWLSHIPSLKYLNLSGIDLRRGIDSLQLISTLLPSLLELRLKECELDSVIPCPSFVNFTSLTLLDVSINNFNSKVFEWVSNISNSLSYLDLSWNQVEGIPDTFLNLQNLRHLFLNQNKLNGTIPEWFGQLKNLQELDLFGNSLHGSIPLILGNLSSLTLLYVGGNSLEGVLSESNFANLANLKALDLSSLAFTFNISSDWIPPFQLEEISLGSCNLGPKFPSWLYTQRFLQVLDISNAGISFVDHDKFWSIVSNITDHLDISKNSISGDISNWVLNTKSIYLTSNKFNGELPLIDPSVETFFAGNNYFSGSISPMLCGNGDAQHNQLSFLDLCNNLLSGELSDCWMNRKNLVSIDLGHNNLTGRIPPSIGSLSSLMVLNLNDNNLFGDVPLSLQHCNQLEFLHLGRNQLSGSIPSWLTKSMIAISLRSNGFIGNIPPQICQHSSLNILDFADNSLSGSIPQCFYNLTAMKNGSAFDVSYYVVPDLNHRSPYIFRFLTKGQELKYKIGTSNLWRLVDLSKKQYCRINPT